MTCAQIIDPAAHSADSASRADWLWAALPALAATVCAILLSGAIFGRIPHVQDSIAQLFQARIFAGGRLWAPAPPLPELFDYTHVVIADGRWYSQYPPGHSLLLVPGVWLGLPYLINPLLGGLSILGTFLLARELFGRSIARLAVLLAAASPFLLLMSAEFMSHASSLFAMTFFLFFFFRALRTQRVSDGAVAGIFCALGLLVRPYSAVAIALPCALLALARLRNDRALMRPFAWTAGLAAAGLLLLLLYNWGTTGSPFVFGYSKLAGDLDVGLGFGKGPVPHTPGRGLHFTWQRLTELNERLFEWPVTSLWPIAVALAIAALRGGRAGRRAWLLASFPASLLVLYFFYWYQDANDCFGPRYLYEALGPLVILASVGVAAVGEALAQGLRARGGASRWGFLLSVAVVVALTAASIAFRWPDLVTTRSVGAAGPDLQLTPGNPFEIYNPNFWGVSPALGNAVEARIHDRAIVFVDTRVPAVSDPARRRIARQLKFGSAFAHENPAWQRARVLFAHLAPVNWTPPANTTDADLARMMRENAAQFPGRSIYFHRASWEAPRPVVRD